jgi:hypothetical protein
VGAVVAIIAASQQRRFIAAFHDAGATSAQTARPLAEIGANDARLLRALMNQGVVCEPSPGRYFFDDAAYAALLRSRRPIALLVLALALLGVLLGVFVALTRR